MKIKNINIGQILKITGSNRGCDDSKCINCKFYPEHMIKVRKINIEKQLIEGVRINSTEFCNFDPRDLSPLTWKARFK